MDVPFLEVNSTPTKYYFSPHCNEKKRHQVNVPLLKISTANASLGVSLSPILPDIRLYVRSDISTTTIPSALSQCNNLLLSSLEFSLILNKISQLKRKLQLS